VKSSISVLTVLKLSKTDLKNYSVYDNSKHSIIIKKSNILLKDVAFFILVFVIFTILTTNQNLNYEFNNDLRANNNGRAGIAFYGCQKIMGT